MKVYGLFGGIVIAVSCEPDSSAVLPGSRILKRGKVTAGRSNLAYQQTYLYPLRPSTGLPNVGEFIGTHVLD